VKVWNNQINWELALAGDIRYNPTTQMMEVYNGKSWITVAPQSTDEVRRVGDVDEFIHEITKKNEALDELFGVK
jgi:hypothetical protein